LTCGPNLSAAFRKGLSETGYVEGRNVAIEYRWANNENDRLPELAADLVRRRVAVIATQTNLAARAAKASTVVIPIVFNTSTDPVQTGLVASLNRPGANVTGVTYVGTDIEGKQLGLLHELLPGAVRFAVPVNPAALIVAESTIQGLQLAASTIGRQIEILSASTSREIETALASLPHKGADALLVAPSTLFLGRRVQLTTLVVRVTRTEGTVSSA
jgi:putative tryptophan/tyrosine transport system substrate-binding protein